MEYVNMVLIQRDLLTHRMWISSFFSRLCVYSVGPLLMITTDTEYLQPTGSSNLQGSYHCPILQRWSRGLVRSRDSPEGTQLECGILWELQLCLLSEALAYPLLSTSFAIDFLFVLVTVFPESFLFFRHQRHFSSKWIVRYQNWFCPTPLSMRKLSSARIICCYFDGSEWQL